MLFPDCRNHLCNQEKAQKRKEKDEWPGAFGSVTFRLREGRHNGEPIYFIRTDASEATFAEENELIFVPH